VHKTTLLVDDDVIKQASEILGTTGIKDTIDAALHQVLVKYAREHWREIFDRHIDEEVLRNVRKLAWRQSSDT